MAGGPERGRQVQRYNEIVRLQQQLAEAQLSHQARIVAQIDDLIAEAAQEAAVRTVPCACASLMIALSALGVDSELIRPEEKLIQLAIAFLEKLERTQARGCANVPANQSDPAAK
jgi:hypothetical protein